jgi:deoxyribose-phosphate aldolase
MLEIARAIDHTLLSPLATAEQIERLCAEAVEWDFASVCIPPRFVSQANRCLIGSSVAVGTVVGFPLGYATTAVKVFETREAVAAGALEIDMVISLGAALDGRLKEVEEEIRQVVVAAGPALVKVIIECCYLGRQLKQLLTEMVVAAGAGYVKTSTGFGSGGAVLEDVGLLFAAARRRIGVKAAGGIRDLETCRAFLNAGASRIGTRAGVAIMHQLREGEQK